MATTFIKTAECARQAVQGSGEFAEVINEALCGAKNLVAKLHWIGQGDRLLAEVPAAKHELLYLLEGDAVITLNQQDYNVSKGAGVYLGPNEKAAIRPAGAAAIKLFHLAVPEVEDQK